ncbi:protoporphyrinogen oxidase, partial [candidate division KSB1 bacterium]
FKQEDVQHPLDGFGFLAPKKEKRQILGTLWNSSIFPERAPAGRVLLTTFIGGARQPHLADLSDEKLIELTLKELRELIGAQGLPEFMHVRRYARAIPQYALGHQRYQQIIDHVENDFPGLHFAANYRDGVSVSDCIVRAHRIAETIVQAHASSKKHEALAFV